VVRVEAPGQAPKLRQYKAGTDVGKGSASKLKSLNFAFNSSSGQGVSP
jgi:hypothetical protein